jgi:hypothetical protein
MKHALRTFSFLLLALLCPASAQSPVQPKPPVGIPAEARLHNGKWYQVYLVKGGWKRAREKCQKLGGQLAIIPDASTQAFIKDIAQGLQLWLGATDEKVEKRWLWVDGTPVKFTAWADRQPDNTDGIENYLQTFDKDSRWNDGAEDDRFVVGFICEWRAR